IAGSQASERRGGRRLTPLFACQRSQRKQRIGRWNGSTHWSGRATSGSWPTSTRARPRRPSGSSITPGARTRSARSTKAPRRWTGWCRSRSAASRSRRPRRPASGVIAQVGLVWNDDDESLGKEYTKIEIPADMAEQVKEYREKMIEGLAEVDEHLMEKYVHGEPITPAELKAAVRKGTISMKLFPV